MDMTVNPKKQRRPTSLNTLTRGSTVSEAVRSQIKHYILEQGLKAGDPLPPETQWAQELGVNRSSVREAVKSLEALGFIQIRHGQGLFVRERNFDPLLETLNFDVRFNPATLLQLAQLRTWLELMVLPEAFEKIGTEQIASMEAILQEWREGFHTERSDRTLLASPNIDVLWGMYDEMALGGLAAIKARGLGGKITVMGYDNTPDAYAAIKRGEMHVTVDTAPKEMGYNLLHAIKKYVMDGRMVPKVIRSEIAVWDRSNIDRFDTDRYYHAPMRPQVLAEAAAVKVAGLAPAWMKADGQIVSVGREVPVGHTGQEPPPTRKAAPIKVGFIPTARNAHYEIVVAGAKTAIDELGGDDVIELSIHFPPDQTAIEEQIRIVESCMERGCDALAICTNDDRALTPTFKKAAERGIPVFLFNMPLALSRNPFYVSNVGYDQREAGRLIGLWLVQHFGHTATNVAVLEGLPGLHNDERLGGFEEAIEGNENIKVVTSQPADWLRDKGEVVVDHVFQVEQDRQFHRALYTALGNEMLVRLLDVFWLASANILVDHPAHPETDLSDHIDILAAIKAHDLDGALAALERNLLRMQERIRHAVDAT